MSTPPPLIQMIYRSLQFQFIDRDVQLATKLVSLGLGLLMLAGCGDSPKDRDLAARNTNTTPPATSEIKRPGTQTDAPEPEKRSDADSPQSIAPSDDPLDELQTALGKLRQALGGKSREQIETEARNRMQCNNNFKQIALATLNYHASFAKLPPAYTVDENGNRLHSWRTLLLPYMEQGKLYDQINFDKPWDDPENFALLNREMPCYRCPSQDDASTNTIYVAVVDPQGVFSGSKACTMDEITDGSRRTLLAIEASPEHAVHWASPQDIDLATLQDIANASTVHNAAVNAVLVNGEVHALSARSSPKVLKTLVTKDGGEMPVGF